MPWWIWLVLVPLAGIAFIVLAMRSFRRGVREQFIEYLREAYPQFEVVGQSNAKLDLKIPGGGEGELYLHKLYSACAGEKSTDALNRRSIFEHFAGAILADQEDELRELDPAKDASRVMPRLVTKGFLEQLPPEADAPSRPLGNTGLFVAYVLDSPQRVSYMARQHVSELQLADDDELHALALANLRRISSPEFVRGAVEKQSLMVSKNLDTYDAARLLLVPENLRGGEALVAAVPDRDTLALVPLPRDQAKGFPMTPDNTDHLLLNKPLWVTRDGIELA